MPHKRSLVPTEYEECLTFTQWCQYHPIVSKFLIKHVNEGKRSALGGIYLNHIGMRKGLPDYQIPLPNEKYVGLWIEMKLPKRKNSKMPEDQIWWINHLLAVGHYATFAYGAEEAIKITQDYFDNKL